MLLLLLLVLLPVSINGVCSQADSTPPSLTAPTPSSIDSTDPFFWMDVFPFANEERFQVLLIIAN